MSASPTCGPLQRRLAVVLLAALTVSAAGCGASALADVLARRSSAPPAHAYEPATQRADLAGVWTGVFRGSALYQRRVQFAVGAETHLLVEGEAPVPLVPAGRDGEEFLFEAPAGAELDAAPVRRVVARLQPSRGELFVEVEWASGRQKAGARLARPRPLASLRGDAPRNSAVLAYESWRTRAGGAPYDEERIWTLVRHLEDEGWECVRDEALTVPAGGAVTWATEQSRFDTEVYVIRVEDGADRLAFGVSLGRGSPIRILTYDRTTDYPVVGVRPTSLGEPAPVFTFFHYEADADRAAAAHGAAAPIRVTVLQFGDPKSYTRSWGCDATTW